MWVDAPNHIDLYDVEKYLEPAVNKTVEWFNKYLSGKPKLRHQLTEWLFLGWTIPAPFFLPSLFQRKSNRSWQHLRNAGSLLSKPLFKPSLLVMAGKVAPATFSFKAVPLTYRQLLFCPMHLRADDKLTEPGRLELYKKSRFCNKPKTCAESNRWVNKFYFYSIISSAEQKGDSRSFC